RRWSSVSFVQVELRTRALFVLRRAANWKQLNSCEARKQPEAPFICGDKRGQVEIKTRE
ncbi:hypothetical protein NPIL_378061, partial [Nephila pilipes]